MSDLSQQFYNDLKWISIHPSSSEVRKIYAKYIHLIDKRRKPVEARRTGWRIIKDWVDSQIALMEIQLAKPEEIFLPYMYDEKTGKTMFELLEERGFNTQLEYKPESTPDPEVITHG